MLRIPSRPDLKADFYKELVDECMATSEERSSVYQKAAQYYWTGSADVRGAIHNKIKPWVDRLAGFLYLPQNVRFNCIFDSSEAADVLERGRSASQMLTAQYRQSDADLRFSDAVTWGLISGCYLLKHFGSEFGFKVVPVHPINFGVLGEAITSLDEQECICHVSFPTVTRVRSMLHEYGHPDAEAIYNRLMETRLAERDEQEPSYFHQMVVGGMRPLGDVGSTPEAAGIVQAFPVPTPWRPQRRVSPTVRFCELWIKDERKNGDYTTVQMIYPDIIIEGMDAHRNLLGGPPLWKHQPFVKVEADETPGYFWGRSIIADIQMLQELVNKRLRDLKILWDRNAAAPKMFSGITSITEEQYYKIISEGGFINDPNPNAKSTSLAEAPQQGYLEELEFIWKMYDEAGGFTPVMTGQGESGVRSGAHAQTLVRTSSPGLIDPATRIERQLAESGYLCLRLMQDRDPHIYKTDSGTEFTLGQLPDPFQVEVDAHSASPAFAEDSRQIAIALARANAISSEDLLEMLHPPNAELLLARLRQRQAQAAKQHQQEVQQMIAHGINPEAQGGAHKGGKPH